MNDNQLFLLKHIDSSYRSLNSFLRHLSNQYEKPLSTLKRNAKILKELNLINYGDKNMPSPVELTTDGEIVLWILDQINSKE
ncbi:MAG: hypothetical protein ACOC85_04990 [Thermoplasmatota archaeon]